MVLVEVRKFVVEQNCRRDICRYVKLHDTLQFHGWVGDRGIARVVEEGISWGVDQGMLVGRAQTVIIAI